MLRLMKKVNHFKWVAVPGLCLIISNIGCHSKSTISSSFDRQTRVCGERLNPKMRYLKIVDPLGVSVEFGELTFLGAQPQHVTPNQCLGFEEQGPDSQSIVAIHRNENWILELQGRSLLSKKLSEHALVSTTTEQRQFIEQCGIWPEGVQPLFNDFMFLKVSTSENQPIVESDLKLSWQTERSGLVAADYVLSSKQCIRVTRRNQSSLLIQAGSESLEIDYDTLSARELSLLQFRLQDAQTFCQKSPYRTWHPEHQACQVKRFTDYCEDPDLIEDQAIYNTVIVLKALFSENGSTDQSCESIERKLQVENLTINLKREIFSQRASLDLNVLEAYANNIAELTIYDFPLNRFESLRKFKNLKSLELTSTYMEDFSLITELKNLERLTLSIGEINSIAGIENLKKLTYLNLADQNIESIAGISQLKHLSFLDLSENNIRNLSEISDLKHLKEVNISFNRDSAIPNLHEHKYISKLTAGGSFLYTNLQVQETLANLPPNLEYLDLSASELVDIDALVNVYDQENSQLKTLILQNNQIASFGRLIEINSIEELRLEKNVINSLAGLQGHSWCASPDGEAFEAPCLVRVYLNDNCLIDGEEPAIFRSLISDRSRPMRIYLGRPASSQEDLPPICSRASVN